MASPHPRAVELTSGNARAFVYPEHGFQLHGYEVDVPGSGTVPVVYGPPERGEPWDRRYGNPILFPSIVYCHGAEPNSYPHAGKNLLMPQHGWARDLYWHVESLEKHAVAGWLEPSHGVALAFPFQFRLGLRYSLVGEALQLDAEVANLGAEPCPFALGFHPYLCAPLAPGGARDVCHVELPAGVRLRTSDDWKTVTRASHPARRVELSNPELGEGFVLEQTGAKSLEVVDPGAGLATCVSVESSEQPLPLWAVWSAAPDAAYVCLEPWSDEPNSLNRPSPRSLAPGERLRYRMTIALRRL